MTKELCRPRQACMRGWDACTIRDVTPLSRGPVANPPTCENLYILGVPISHSFPAYLIHKNTKMYTLFTWKQNYFSRPQPSLLRTHGLEGASSSRVPERVVP